VNRGQGAAFNAGFHQSHGEILMFLDADDWLYPQAAQRVVESWVPGESKTHFRLDLVDGDGTSVDVHPPLEVPLDGGDVRPLLFKFGRYETAVTTGNAFARPALGLVMPMPEEAFVHGADGYLAISVPFHGPVVSLEERLGAYRMHGNNAYAGSQKAETVAAFLKRAHRRLAHDEARDIVLRAKAEAVGVRVRPSLYLQDANHLELRLASLRLGPDGHPYRDDNRFVMSVRGIAASLHGRLAWSHRLVKAAWFVVAGMFPSGLASGVIRWKMMPGNRPVAVDRGLKWLRRLLWQKPNKAL
jgi:glycosyltransferase involved in cell wall biosynthesis